MSFEKDLFNGETFAAGGTGAFFGLVLVFDINETDGFRRGILAESKTYRAIGRGLANHFEPVRN